MRITIHRGIDQIGGCITEIATDKARIMIDLGRNLPDNKGVSHDPKANAQAVEALTQGVDAIFYSHYHGDHIGLMEFVPATVDQHIGQTAKEVMLVKSQYVGSGNEKERVQSLKPFYPLKKIRVKDMTVTPFLVSHSACDSYMFLVESAGKKILHTGDFRDHGYIGKGLWQFLPKYVGQVDFLITEGTMLSRGAEQVPTEHELQQRVKKLMRQYKYVFALGSSTDIDRLATFYKANPKGRLFVCDHYQAKILNVFTERNGLYCDLYKFDDLSRFPRDFLLDEMVDNGFCMMVRVNQYYGKYTKFTNLAIDRIPQNERLLLYSMWSGYIDPGAHQKAEYVEFLAKFDHHQTIHTSGHATKECLAEVCRLTNPRLGIIPIHSEQSERYRELPIADDLRAKIITESSSFDGVEVVMV